MLLSFYDTDARPGSDPVFVFSEAVAVPNVGDSFFVSFSPSDPLAFNPKVLAAGRAISCTRWVVNSVVHHFSVAALHKQSHLVNVMIRRADHG